MLRVGTKLHWAKTGTIIQFREKLKSTSFLWDEEVKVILVLKENVQPAIHIHAVLPVVSFAAGKSAKPAKVKNGM